MPEDIRENSKKELLARIEALETTVKALLKAMKAAEDYNGEEFMDTGEYHGISFN